MKAVRPTILGVVGLIGSTACGSGGTYLRPVHPLGVESGAEAQLVAAAAEEASRVAGRVLCLGVRRENQVLSPSDELMSALQTDSVFAIDDCPPIYSHALVQVDQDGNPIVPEPPPGYEEPVRLILREWTFHTEASASVVFMYGNVSGWYYYCDSSLSDQGTTASCERRGGWIA